MKKIFFFDFDGTLLPNGSNQEVHFKTIYALESLIMQGHDVVIATGRPESMIKNQISIINKINHITLNGAQIIIDNCLVHAEKFSDEEISVIFDAAEKYKLMIGCPTLDEYYIINKNLDKDIASKFFADISSPMPNVEKEIKKGDIISQLWILGDFENIVINKDLFSGKNLLKCHEYAYDIINNNVSKALGMKKYMKTVYPNDCVQTFAFGDGINDIEMLEFADIGVAMGNAVPILKRVADEVIESCEDLGVYNYLLRNKHITPYK